MVKIALLMMVKNEEERILTSIESVLGVCNDIIIYDTGSTDSTIEKVENYCQQYNLRLHLKCEPFIDFGSSRNLAIQFAKSIESDWEYLLLMDANDELRGGDILVEKLSQNSPPVITFLMLQQIQSSLESPATQFYNIKVIKRECDWLYRGKVHESFELTEERLQFVNRLPEGIYLYQNKSFDIEKTKIRGQRDVELLKEEINEDPENSRAVYYLAQTFDIIGNDEMGIKYHQMRIKMKGNVEEAFNSCIKLARYAEKRNDLGKVLEYYFLAYRIQKRAEPMVNLSHIFFYKLNITDMAYYCALLACQAPYPNGFLYFDLVAYKYTRWALLAKIALFIGERVVGKQAAIKAYNYSNSKEDMQMLDSFL